MEFRYVNLCFNGTEPKSFNLSGAQNGTFCPLFFIYK